MSDTIRTDRIEWERGGMSKTEAIELARELEQECSRLKAAFDAAFRQAMENGAGLIQLREFIRISVIARGDVPEDVRHAADQLCAAPQAVSGTKVNQPAHAVAGLSDGEPALERPSPAVAAPSLQDIMESEGGIKLQDNALVAQSLERPLIKRRAEGSRSSECATVDELDKYIQSDAFMLQPNQLPSAYMLMLDIAHRLERDLAEVAGVCHEEIEQRIKLERLLGRIRQWDMLEHAADGRFWTHEIDAVLNAAPRPVPCLHLDQEAGSKTGGSQQAAVAAPGDLEVLRMALGNTAACLGDALATYNSLVGREVFKNAAPQENTPNNDAVTDERTRQLAADPSPAVAAPVMAVVCNQCHVLQPPVEACGYCRSTDLARLHFTESA